ncbi:hypothetical protein IC582_023682 [Cucumis melo]
MEEEYSALLKENTWSLVPPSPSQNVVGSKWVFRLKRHIDGSILRYKARMVAKGFHQHPGVDFFEMFNPVIKASTIRVVLSIAVTNGWLLRQLDFNNAFLNGHLEENVYMMQPPGYVHLSYPNYACKLNKAIYGLKQAPREWNATLSKEHLKWGFINSRSNFSLFIFRRNNYVVLLLVYVDDIIVTGNDSVLISTLIKSLDKQFALKDLGRLTYFLGFQVNYLESGFILNQGKYISDLLHKLQLSDLKPAPSPSVVGKNLFAFGGTPLEDPFVYRNTIGALQYLTNTRPDIAYIINQLSQFLQKPTDLHWQAVKCVLKYLSGTKSFGLMFQQGDDLAISAYSDADWASNINDRKSIVAYCIFIGNTLVFWSSKKQTVVARSSTKSEYRALALVASEVIWLKQLLLELTSYPSRKPVIWCDNISSGALAMNPVFHARTKHIEIDVHFVRDQVLKGALEVRYVSSVD